MPNCCVCNKSINEWLESDGNKYCSESCFRAKNWPKCEVCKKSMGEWFTDEVGKKYCSNTCLSESFPRCDSCGKKMSEFIVTVGKKYCSEKCSMHSWPKCSICLKPMNEWITDDNGEKYCSDNCFAQTLPVCDCCGKRMKEWKVYEDGKKYCSEQCSAQSWPKCFACGVRMKSWQESEDGKKYCSEKCISSTWPKCDVCSKPMHQWSETKDGKRYCSTNCAETVLPTCDCCGLPMSEWYETDLGCFCSNLCSETERNCSAISKDVRSASSAAGAAINSIQYAENVVLNAERGHGFAAEKANHLFDKVSGKNAEIVGDDNIKNGADRLVDGIEIQTKYCKSGAKCVEECFDNGKFRYINSDGHPMQIEVPSDKYDAAVQALKNRIYKGQVPGVKDPSEAINIIRKGQFSYEQARSIAKFGTVESITYDVANGIVAATSAMGLSATISFMYALWSGKDINEAVQMACTAGFQVGGVVWVSGVLSSQLGRTGLESSLRGTSDAMVKQLGSKASALIANGLRDFSSPIAGQAAMNNLSKLMRGSVVTGVASTIVLSSVDIYRMFDGKISGKQLFKNIASTATSVSAGLAGYSVTGAAALWAVGTTLTGPVGWIIGGIGACIGGVLGAKTAKVVLDELIEDDAKELFVIFKRVLTDQAECFLLTENEIVFVSKAINDINFAEELRNMYAASNHRSHALSLIKPIVVKVVASRKSVALPTENELIQGFRMILDAV